MGCCLSRRPPDRPGLYMTPEGPNSPLAIGPGFYTGEQAATERILNDLERKGLPVPTKDIFGKPLVRMGKVKENDLAAAIAADPEFWNTPIDMRGQQLQGEELEQYWAQQKPVNPRPGMKRKVLPRGRVVYTGGYGLFGEWRENLHK